MFDTQLNFKRKRIVFKKLFGTQLNSINFKRKNVCWKFCGVVGVREYSEILEKL